MQPINFISFTFACVAGLQPGPIGIYTQIPSSIPATPGNHQYVKLLEFDTDNTFYYARGFNCIKTFCPRIAIIPYTGTYTSKADKTSKFSHSYKMNFTPSIGPALEFTISYTKNQDEITLSDGKTGYPLVKKAGKCQFGAKPDSCNQIDQGYQCAKDNQCRLSGRFNTSCKTSDNCNNMYQCKNLFCSK